ncbi:arsenic resistance N-acetyltransferase ArsN2 [Halopiger aswanensis]|uniref:Amino-acid N-acetyltransferase n=1 Tax=Halopiger aswanensis TaxID=148449 RepID=A0A3R7DF02_9EURY|nr:arsenic resistance N-acetyltransferase ArsN2 [Halopiger aswanensis]RKD97537.1 amino-acid N-acetyltransferase [Halopiger aswanensis]
MDSASITLRPIGERGGARDPDLAYVESLLEATNLPNDDVREKPEAFYIASDGDERVGIGGLEQYGGDGLLRSLVVESGARSNGYGTAICDALEEAARADGIERLYLLTTTAAEFFADRGYERIDRSDAPPAIRRTDQFADLCPATATCLRRSL